MNLWQYTAVSPSDATDLNDASSDAEFDALMDQFGQRDSTLAVAVDGFGIVSSRPLPAESDRDAVISALFKDFNESLGRLQHVGQEQRDLALA